MVLDRAIDVRQQLGVKRIQTELKEIKKFENMLYDKIQELEIELEDSTIAREKEILVNQTDTLTCVLDHLFNVKPGSDEIRNIKMAETNNNYQKANRRKQLRSRILRMRLMLILVVCTLMISTIDLSQNFVFAQNTTFTLLPSQLPAQDKYLYTCYTSFW